jgi:hypothetical protein
MYIGPLSLHEFCRTKGHGRKLIEIIEEDDYNRKPSQRI